MPTTEENFASVVDFHVAFAPHSLFPDAIADMNTRYSSNLSDPGVFFTDVRRTNVRSTTEIHSILKERVIGDLIAPDAHEDVIVSDIRNALKASPIKVGSPTSGIFRRLNHGNLLSALRESIANGCTTIQFKIDVLHLTFATADSPGLNFLTWTHTEPLRPIAISTPAPSGGHTSPSTTITANDIADAVTAGISALQIHTAAPPLTAKDIAAAVTAGVAAMNIPAAVTAGLSAFSPSTPSTSTPTGPSANSNTLPVTGTNPTSIGGLYTFNYKNLPQDVQTRYLNKVKNRPILGSTVSAPYSHGNFHHLEPPDKLVLADGTVFILNNPPNDKDLFKAPLTCDDDTHAGIRSWYAKFVQYCMDYGYYVHPLWCFRPNHGGPWGFSAGDDPDDDLPRSLDMRLHRMAQPLFRLLSKKDMFPKDSKLHGLVTVSDGDGYRALKNVLFYSHPAFHDQPSTLITSYPKQRNLDILHYAQLFRDFHQLRAYISNNPATLDDVTEIDIFIGNLKHADFVNRVTRDERRQPALASHYTGSQLIETIMKHLMAPDSPARLDNARSPLHDPPVAARSPPPKYVYTAKKPYPRTTPTRVNRIQYDETHPTDAVTVASVVPPPLDTPTNTLDSEESPPFLTTLHAIRAPDNSQDQATFHQYCASVHRIHTDPNQASVSSCIVCGDPHRFDACPILKNNDFLRSHYIRYCQHLKRDATARSSAFPSPNHRQIHHLALTSPTPSISSSSDDDFSNGSQTDFQLGRV